MPSAVGAQSQPPGPLGGHHPLTFANTGVFTSKKFLVCFETEYTEYQAYQVAQGAKNLPASTGDARDVGSIPGLEDPLEEEMATRSLYSCLGNPMRGAWWATVHRVAKNWTCLSD